MVDVGAELSLFLQPFIDRFGHGRRGAMCRVYIAGLPGPEDRKGMEPMAVSVDRF